MHATTTVVRDVPPPGRGDHAAADAQLGSLAASPGFAGGWVVRPLGGRDATVISLWDSAEQAAVVGVPYEVRHDSTGVAADQPARYARLVWFDGPRSAALVAAEQYAGAHRVGPAVEGLAGSVRQLNALGVDGASLTVILATSVESLEEGTRRIMSTELLHDEDPALLPGPDRVEVASVLAARDAAGARR